jgi:type IX secretion system PorP/SprF family membrane protein
MIRKYFALALVALLFAAKSHAQQDPYYSFFMFNKMAYNPAYAGSKDAVCATSVYKKQWSGFAGAPEFQTLNINSPIAKQRAGVGLGLINDKLGYENSLNVVFSFAYKIKLNSAGTSNLAVGAAGGFMQKSLDGTKLKPEQMGDPKIPISKVSATAPDINGGVYYTNTSIGRLKNVYAGLSATHLMQSTISYTTINGNTVDSKLATHYYLMAGAALDLTSSLTLEPNILIKQAPGKMQVDLNAFVLYNNKIRGGVIYRSGDALIGLIGYQFTENFHAGYSYDFTTSQLSKFSGGSHEIYVTYCFKFKPPVPKIPNIRLTPRYL